MDPSRSAPTRPLASSSSLFKPPNSTQQQQQQQPQSSSQQHLLQQRSAVDLQHPSLDRTQPTRLQHHQSSKSANNLSDLKNSAALSSMAVDPTGNTTASSKPPPKPLFDPKDDVSNP